MTFKVGDRVKFIFKKDKLMKIKKGDKGTVVALEDESSGGDYEVVRVDFDNNKRKAIGVCDYEIELVGPKTKTTKLRKLRATDKVLLTSEDEEFEQVAVIVVNKLKYSHMANTIEVTGYTVDDHDVELVVLGDVDDTVEVVV